MIRDSYSYRDPSREHALDAMLLAGNVRKKFGDWNATLCTNNPAEIARIKKHGIYHSVFGSSPGQFNYIRCFVLFSNKSCFAVAIVPRIFFAPDVIPDRVKALTEALIKIEGLVAEPIAFRRTMQNQTKRLQLCVPPNGFV